MIVCIVSMKIDPVRLYLSDFLIVFILAGLFRGVHFGCVCTEESNIVHVDTRLCVYRASVWTSRLQVISRTAWIAALHFPLHDFRSDLAPFVVKANCLKVIPAHCSI